MKQLFLLATLLMALSSSSQSLTPTDSLKSAILSLQLEVNEINMNLSNGQKRFQSGVIVSAIGYSVTIAGGMMLGRENDELGQVLLVAGGVTGLTGTVLLVDAVAVLTGKKRKR